MKDLDAAFGTLITTAARFDMPVDAIVERAHRRIRRRRAIVSVCVVLVGGVTAGIVGVHGSHNSGKPAINVQTPAQVARAAGEPLAFREVLGVVPYGKAVTEPTTPQTPRLTCGGGAFITPVAEQAPSAHVVLPDQDQKNCYALGPVLLAEKHVGSANAVLNQNAASWEVDVAFANDDFVTKVARPAVNRRIAIVVDGVVESAPTINPGITGRDVTISGSFDEAEALRVAKLISPDAVARPRAELPGSECLPMPPSVPADRTSSTPPDFCYFESP